MFWADARDKSIYRAAMDGYNVTKLISSQNSSNGSFHLFENSTNILGINVTHRELEH